MKKALLYLLSLIGVVSILFFSYTLLMTTSGTTMYGGRPAAVPIMAKNSDNVAMSSGQVQEKPSENVMRRMIIRNAELTLQVNHINQTMDDISQLADASGGYVVSSNIIQNGNGSGSSRAVISIRVPAQGLNNALTQLKSFANQVIQESVSGEDITQQYVNLESQLNNLQKSKIQLEKIMLGATSTEDVLKVHQQLSETQGQIDVLEGQIKYYKESVAFSLINVSLIQNPIFESDDLKQWRVIEVFKTSYKHLISGLRDFTYKLIQFTVYLLPLILLWGAFCLLILWIGRKIYILIRGS